MVMGPKGTIFMGTRLIGRVYAITEKDGKREVKTIIQGLTQPNGLAFKDGALYVLAIHRVLRYDNIEDKLDNVGEPVELTDKFGLPPEVHHNWKYAAFGPDGKLYVQVGANCNICEINPGVHGQIRRYNADGSGMEIVARGVRNTVGFDWHPVTKELWFTDNGRDWAGNDGPQDELNRIAKGQEGANFGFPYCHANGIPDPDIKRPNPCAGVVLPAALTGPHSAGLGIKFYTGNMFPETYKNVAFIARRGSWNREKKFGYDVVLARTQAERDRQDRAVHDRVFWTTAKNEFYGRPTYVLQMPDGAMLVSDEQNGAIYRISSAQKTAATVNRRDAAREWWRPPALGLAAAVFCAGAAFAQSLPLAERITLCGTCHGEDGNSRMANMPSLAGQPEFFVYEPADPDARGRAADRRDDAAGQGSQG